MARLTLTLPLIERDALIQLAEREYRDPRAQAALIIRNELERLGLVVTSDAQANQAGPILTNPPYVKVNA